MDNFFTISSIERVHSYWNYLQFYYRNKIAFSRPGYYESCALPDWMTWKKQLPLEQLHLVHSLEEKYSTENFLSFLHLDNYKKNLATLWILEQFSQIDLSPFSKLLAFEVGSQDFSRAPALHSFLMHRRSSHSSQIQKNFSFIGIEIDAFPILSNWHSRFDLAFYYSRFLPETYYLVENFFLWMKCANLIFSFYPFVSPHPAIAWGLPLTFGNAGLWVESFQRNLSENSLLLVAHQGKWEEEEFDEARSNLAVPWDLLERKVLNCAFYPSKFPIHVSLYRKTGG